jgi:hypothetical protein
LHLFIRPRTRHNREWVKRVATERIKGDRRNHRRYQINLELTYRHLFGKRTIPEGTGRILNMGSGGLLFETAGTLPIGANVEVKVHWPYRSESGVPLRLVVTGRVVRASDGQVAVQLARHKFVPATEDGGIPIGVVRSLLRG